MVMVKSSSTRHRLLYTHNKANKNIAKTASIIDGIFTIDHYEETKVI